MRVITQVSDPDISTLYNKYMRGRLVLRPDFQRKYVWDKKKASSLVESILIGVPLPAVYLAEEGGKEIVVDGQQRLTSIFNFLKNCGDEFGDEEFELDSLDALTELEGKTFAQLPDEFQERILSYPIRQVLIVQDNDEGVKFDVFTRLNTGAVKLNAMEMRHCLYRGAFMDKLEALASYEDFVRAFPISDVKESRMANIELVLRFAAFYHRGYTVFGPSLKSFLDMEACSYKDVDDNTIKEFEEKFKSTVRIIMSVFGPDHSFRLFSVGENGEGNWAQKENVALYEAMMVAFSMYDVNIIMRNADRIYEGLLELMSADEDFRDTLEHHTTSKARIILRIDKIRAVMNKIIDITEKPARCFSSSLKKELFDESNVCQICGNIIKSIDDAHIDHIKQYWTGGNTIPENARLVHRYCNLTRPRQDISV